MRKIVVFDFDGTIANTIPVSIEILKRIAKEEFDVQISDKLIAELRDKPIPEVFRELGISIVKLPFIASRAKKELNKRIETLRPIKGVDVLLKRLTGKGLLLGIVSSNSSDSIKKFLKENNLEVFDFVYTNSLVFGKPSSLRKVLNNYHCRKDEVFYVGDEIRDVEAARKIGINIASVTWGVNSGEKLLACKPDVVVDSPSELESFLLGRLVNGE